MPLRILSLHPPWSIFMATLVDGQPLKWIETRNWSAHPTAVGQRLGIASTKGFPAYAKELLQPPAGFGTNRYFDALRDGGWKISWDRRKLVHNLPLSAIVAAGTLVASLPMFADVDTPDDAGDCVRLGNGVAVVKLGARTFDVSSQLPYGDFQPGRFAWLMPDVRPTTVRCPWCWGDELDETCPACGGAGSCDPIPFSGGQGLSKSWQPSKEDR
jgi:hypothetical protein